MLYVVAVVGVSGAERPCKDLNVSVGIRLDGYPLIECSTAIGTIHHQLVSHAFAA